MAGDKEMARKQFEKAELALKKQNLEYAIELYLQGLTLDPKAAEERRKLHQVETLAIQEKGGNPQGGFAVKMKGLGLEANIKKLHMQKRHEEEIIELEKSLRHQPQNVNTLMALGAALEIIEAWQGAVVTYEEVLHLDSTHVEAYRKLGKIYGGQLDDPEKAINYWEKVKQYKPDDKEAGKAIRDLSAATMVKKAEERKAQAGDESFRSMLKDQAQSEDLQKQQQISRTDEDRLRMIKFKYEEVKKDPKNSRLYRELGTLLQELKMWDKAETCFKKALEVNPQDLFAAEKLGQLKESHLDSEIAELKAKANGSTPSPEVKELIKKKEAEILQFKVEEYDRRVKAHPTDYTLKLQYGRVLRLAGKIDDAIGQFQKAVKDPKLKVQSKKEIGECFTTKRLYDMAKVQFAEALEEVADKESHTFKELKYNLARACEENGNIDEALKHYQEIMAIDISYQDVSSRVSKLRQEGKSRY
ncbi:MAG: tetratricopeptide repeat protein [Planctomycetes bacterium]|nr:tetratricopeptide repeat protein [Planctomycetota bacterium]